MQFSKYNFLENHKKSTSLIILLISLSFLAIEGCSNENRIEKLRRKKNVLTLRKSKNRFFKESDQSPLPKEDRWSFTALDYYPYNYLLKVKASYTKNTNPVIIEIQTTSDVKRTYAKTGKLDFSINGKQYSLSTYKDKIQSSNQDETSQFIPFSDLTSGNETYEGGRYIDLKITDINAVLIDFNLAYNPYCAYNKIYSCPIPPQENQLNTDIKAGEKNYKH